jgi:TRAP-type C4-dicarboxylate transport system permease small subunit
MLSRAYDRLIVAMAYLAGLLIIGMSLWISYEVVARYVFLRPTIWAADLSEYTLLWSTFLAAPPMTITIED